MVNPITLSILIRRFRSSWIALRRDGDAEPLANLILTLLVVVIALAAFAYLLSH